MKKGILILIVFVLSFGFLKFANNLVGENETGETLTGTAKGFGGDVTVTLVVDGGDILSVAVVGDSETQGIGSNAIEQLPALIVDADSADVDGVSGATYTSNAIKEAVNMALGIEATASDTKEEPKEEPAKEAAAEPMANDGALTGTAKGFGGDVTVTVTVDGDDITAVEVVGKDETQGIGTNAIDKLPALIVEADSTDVDVVSGATYTSKAIIEAVNMALEKAASGDIKEETAAEGGALTGTAKGFGGDVTVTVTVDGDDITAVEVVGKDETQGIGSTAIEKLPALIVDADSTDVDGISGATYTSNAIKEAVDAALAKR
ncbi:MAG: FMN-binding protein [Sedimentibacter sp.]